MIALGLLELGELVKVQSTLPLDYMIGCLRIVVFRLPSGQGYSFSLEATKSEALILCYLHTDSFLSHNMQVTWRKTGRYLKPGGGNDCCIGQHHAFVPRAYRLDELMEWMVRMAQKEYSE